MYGCPAILQWCKAPHSPIICNYQMYVGSILIKQHYHNLVHYNSVKICPKLQVNMYNCNNNKTCVHIYIEMLVLDLLWTRRG